MARTALDAGYDVTVYARWHAGLPPIEDRDGVRIIRAPFGWRFAVPFFRNGAQHRVAKAIAAAGLASGGTLPVRRPSWVRRRLRNLRSRVPPARGFLKLLLPRRTRERVRQRWRMLKMFPLNGIGWAAALEDMVEPADIWHGMWAGSLPALTRLRRRMGGRTIYDSRDVYMLSRSFATAQQPWKWILTFLERRWAIEVLMRAAVPGGRLR